MKKEISPELLQKYLRGEATEEESAYVDEWFQLQEEKPDDIRLQNPIEQESVEKLIFDRIKANISVNEREWQSKKPFINNYPFFRKSFKWAAALGAIAVFGLGALLYFMQKQHGALTSDVLTSIGQLKKISNHTLSAKREWLEDGTLINLSPKSTVEFPKAFSKSTREIKLTGEAFFDVAKDKNRPFIITTGAVVIKVLGTSFNVSAYRGAKEITVAVKTGRVSVSASTTSHQNKKDNTFEEIILTPNQKVVYNTTEENFSKSIVDEPEIIVAKPKAYEMKFDGAPVIKILDAIKKNYGIDIVYDRIKLSDCTITTSMAEEGFYERIEIICKAINAQYQVVDDKILITSNGCQ